MIFTVRYSYPFVVRCLVAEKDGTSAEAEARHLWTEVWDRNEWEERGIPSDPKVEEIVEIGGVESKSVRDLSKEHVLTRLNEARSAGKQLYAVFFTETIVQEEQIKVPAEADPWEVISERQSEFHPLESSSFSTEMTSQFDWFDQPWEQDFDTEPPIE